MPSGTLTIAKSSEQMEAGSAVIVMWMFRAGEQPDPATVVSRGDIRKR